MTKDSKERLLKKASSLFAKKGYTGTSTREIAMEACLNISAITYYFGGKQGLYKAILENIVKTTNKVLKPEIEYATDLLSKDISCEEAENCLYRIIRTFCQTLYYSKVSDDEIHIYLNEYSNPSDCYDILNEGLIIPIYSIFMKLMMKAVGCEEKNCDLETVVLCTFTLFSTCFTFKTRKEQVMKALNWKKLGDQEINKIISNIEQLTKSSIETYRLQLANK
ncbi:MAG: CerR family C-terminal domain-containing protein [Alphaproteobacteria bacterium]|nr:CerR family C-terminal domain-containing protein [Alphaproteobacteria bacterium]